MFLQFKVSQVLNERKLGPGLDVLNFAHRKFCYRLHTDTLWYPNVIIYGAICNFLSNQLFYRVFDNKSWQHIIDAL